jgi:hypothetical protein
MPVAAMTFLAPNAARQHSTNAGTLANDKCSRRLCKFSEQHIEE